MKKLQLVLLAGILIVLAVLTPAQAAVIRVKVGGDDSKDGSTWDLAKATIQAGVAAAASGDEVWVATGVYSDNMTLKSNLALKGGFSGEGTVRDTSVYKTVITDPTSTGGLVIMANGSSVDGFRIEGGTVGINTAVPTSTISNNYITRNEKGIQVYAGAPRITNNYLIENDMGIDLSGSAVPTFTPTIADNVLAANNSGIHSFQSAPYVINNTFVCNNTGFARDASGNAVLSNNILAFNFRGLVNVPNALSHNDVYGNAYDYQNSTPGASDISVDPQFVSLEFADFHIRPGSLCRNAGDGAALNLPVLDMDGQPRTQAGLVDIGADESYSEEYPSPYQPRVVYVAASASPGGDGSDWGHAYSTIQAGVDDTVKEGPAEIWVAEGTYTEQVKTRPFDRLYGGFAVGDTKTSRDPRTKLSMVDPNNIDSGITGIAAAPITVVDGFRVRRADMGITAPLGYSPARFQIVTNNTVSECATGISCGTGIVTTNTVTSNTHGIAPGTDTTVTNNVLTANTIAVYCYHASPTVTNNAIVGNSGGVYTYYSRPLLSNNVIAFNNFGVYKYTPSTSEPTLSHNDVFGNLNGDYIPGELVHETDISADPRFASLEMGNFRIRPSSPCRDAADSATPGVPDVDADGRARPEGPGVDIGAYESYGEDYPDPYPARVVYVDVSAAPGGDGTSWQNAYQVIQAGVADTAQRGPAQVWVARGTYAEQVVMKPFSYLYGGFEPGDTWSDRNPKTKPAIIRSPTNATNSAAITAAACSTVDGFTLRDAFFGVFFPSSKGGSLMTIQGNIVTANHEGIHTAETSALITRNVVRTNDYNGINCSLGAPMIVGNIIVGNGGDGVNVGYSTATVVNNTIFSNSTGVSGSQGSLYAANNIVCFNSSGISLAAKTNTLVNNDVYGNASNDYYPATATHPTDISVDPKLASERFFDPHIRPDSPCRNAGNGATPAVPSVDIDGQTRPEGLAIDIGADESYGEAYPDPYPARVVYIDCQAPPGGDGTCWQKAYGTVQAGVDDTWFNGPGDLWVALGAYREQVKLRRYCDLYGGFASGDTWVDRNSKSKLSLIDGGTGASGGYAVTGAESTNLDGFTLTGNGGILSQGLQTISNNTIVSGQGTGRGVDRAGGMVSGNSISGWQYGVYTSSSAARVANNAISSCAVGIYAGFGAPSIINNTVVGNGIGVSRASYDSSVSCNNIVAFNATGIQTDSTSLSSVLANNDVFGNTTADYSPISSAHATDISLDPLFANRLAGDYHLQMTSPCIDAGTNTGAPLTDIEGSIRPQDGNGDGLATTDIGAYEAPLALPAAKKNFPDGTPVALGGVSVTSKFPNQIYVERTDRASGIRVDTVKDFPIGAMLNMTGTINTDPVTGERFISASPDPTGASYPLAAPGLGGFAIGGGPLGLQDCVWSWRWVSEDDHVELRWLPASSVNTIGLLVKAWGKVTQIDPAGQYFYLDDGSGLRDGTKTGDADNIGVRIGFDGTSFTAGDAKCVTGISSCFKNSDGKLLRLLRVRQSADIQPL